MNGPLLIGPLLTHNELCYWRTYLSMVFVLFVSFDILDLPCLIISSFLLSHFFSYCPTNPDCLLHTFQPWETTFQPLTHVESQRKQRNAPIFEGCSIIQTDETSARNLMCLEPTNGWLSSSTGLITNTTTKNWWILCWLASTPETVSFHPNPSITMSNGVYHYGSQDTGSPPTWRLPAQPRSLHNGIKVKCVMPVWRSTGDICSVATIERSITLFVSILRSRSIVISVYI